MLESVVRWLFWPSLLCFAVGLVLRIIFYVRGLDWQADRVAYDSRGLLGPMGALWSVVAWLIPFGTYGWRRQPFASSAFFMFHFGVVMAPFFAGHSAGFAKEFGITFPAFSSGASDVLAMLGLTGGFLLLVRRVIMPQVRCASTLQDWMLLGLCLLTLASGLLSRVAEGAAVYHVLCGESVLFLAPFTRLAHIALFFASRAQLGWDYAVKRGGQLRGPRFPW